MATVICKRSILFRDMAQIRAGVRTPRTHTIPASRDPQNVPDWLLTDPAFIHAVDHDEIMLLNVLKPTKAEVLEKKPLPQPESTGAEKQPPPSQIPGVITLPLEKLGQMKKAELLEYADSIGLELNEQLTKEDILAAIKQEAAKKP